ncbi:MAG: tetratricopeptide repeat protein [Rhodothermaceae bacterium]|nr:tetratricopeptide repeat protein [Rhodothermaceae bacterium]MYG45668.1 tetratricopeptide repeat protein [Rhodothermaceae bacterium]MYK63209.1 tetratricopeptide repeat protein [Rhodothermaceae bacterium]
MRTFTLLVILLGGTSVVSQAQNGEDLLNVGQYSEAREAFADSLYGVNIEGYFETYLQTGNHESGLRRAQQLLRNSSQPEYVNYAIGRIHMALGNWDGAEDAYITAIQSRNDYWRAGLELADLHRLRGNSRQANRLYSIINSRLRQGGFTTARGLAIGAQAAKQLGAYHEANEAFSTALRLEPDNVQILLWHGDLYQRTHDEAFANERYNKALSINPNRPETYIKLASVTGSYARKEELAKQALQIAEQYAPALALMARLHLLDGNYTEAESVARAALDQDPGHLEAWAHYVAAQHVQGNYEAVSQVEVTVSQRTSQLADFYRVLSEDLALRFRYPDAATYAQKAVESNPENAAANATYATALMRLGEVQSARTYLERSYASDGFNLYAANSLSLLDELDQFSTLTSAHFTLRIHSSEEKVLGPIMLREAERAYEALQAHYGYQPPDRILLEAYNDADDFAVRVAGIPHVGLLGVCFGDVVAMNTPAAQPDISYNWARTLWHELAHTMTVGLSDYRISRWLTEGLSVYEEVRANPAWRRDMEIQFFTAYDQDRLYDLENIDRGFTRPTFQGQVLLSYYHAYRVVDFLSSEYGFDALTRLLSALSQGQTEEAAMQSVFGKSRSELDKEFRGHLDRERTRLDPVLQGWPDMLTEEQHGGNLASYLAQAGQDSFYGLLTSAEKALEQGDLEVAESAYRKALDFYSDYTGPGNPYEGLVNIYRQRNQTAELAQVLQDYLEIQPYGEQYAIELAEILLQQADTTSAVQYLTRSRYTAPYNMEVLGRLAELYADAGQHVHEVEKRRAILALEPVNRAEAQYALAMSLYHNRQMAEAKRAVLQSLEIAPGYREAQRLLLKIVDHPND